MSSAELIPDLMDSVIDKESDVTNVIQFLPMFFQYNNKNFNPENFVQTKNQKEANDTLGSSLDYFET